MKSVTVVIAARNEERTISKTLRSILGFGTHCPTKLPDRIIVVDDGSTDRTAHLASEFTGVEVVSVPESTGKKSRAQNVALALVRTDLVMTVDADTELAPDALEKLVAPHEQDDPPAATCAYVVTKNPRGILQRGRSITYYYGHSFFKFLQSEFNAVMVASGCASVYNTARIRAVGGFTSETVTEDMDMTLRIIMGGKRLGKSGANRVRLVSDAYAWTTDPDTIKLYRAQMRRWHGGFFHNLWIHKHELLKAKNLGFIWIMIGYCYDLVVGLAPMYYYPLQAWLKLNLGSMGKALLWIWGSELLIASIFAMYKGGLRLRRPISTLISLPCYPITRFIDQIYFLEAFYRVVIRRRPPQVWERGH